MKNIRFHTIVTVLVVVACLLSIFPVDENLRLGKDLAGGASLIYTVDVKAGDPPDTLDRTIAVLKDRVNPQGLLEISFQQLGRDQVEITMPLPNDKVRGLRARFDAELAKLKDYSSDTDAFLRAMRLSGAERDAALEALMDTPPRRELLTPVKEAIAKATSARSAYEAARPAEGPAPPNLDALLGEAGEAEAALEAARDRVLASSVSADEFRAALDLPAKGHKVEDSRTGELIEIPSPRAEAIEGFRERIGHLTGAGALIDGILAAHSRYAGARTGLDDPADLIRLLQGAGVLNFRIAVGPGTRPDEEQIRKNLRDLGPGNARVDAAGWFRINSIDGWFRDTDTLRALKEQPAAYFAATYGLVVEPRDGLYYVLLHDAPGLRITKAEGDWSLTNAFVTSDELGKPAVGFRLDPRGASLMGDLTERNVKKMMAIVLDDQVYSAPSINSRIADSGIIQGTFPPEELNYLIKTLSAGSLQAKLGEKPVSQSVLAPELGADNLKQGLNAAWIAFIAIGVFMLGYYFFSGGIAMLALVVNAILVLGIMALQKAAFTLPGIAGVVLTFGTAVDSNVLIYERVREELRHGHDIRTAVRIAFKRVGTTLIDANMVHLLVCLVLSGAIPLIQPPPEIKGFGITLGIGVLGTLFCAIIVTRLILVVLVEHLKAGSWVVNQLPIAVPAVQRAMTWNVNWMRLFPVFVVLSTIFVGIGVYFTFYRGGELLGSEFRGGTSISLRLKDSGGAGGGAMTLTRSEVEDRILKEATETGPLADLRNADVVPVDPRGDGVTSERFTIRTTVTDAAALRDAVVRAFGDVVESKPAIRFAGSDAERVEAAPAYAISDAKLGANIGRPEVENDVSAYMGGVAIVLRDLDPPPTRASLESRLQHMRSDPTYSTDALRREHAVIVLDGSDAAVKSAALVVHDPRYNPFDDEDNWRAKLAGHEWRLVRDALTVPTMLAGVNSFSPSIAASFRAQAILAILLSFVLISIYVWVRFGSIRYSLAAVIPLIHDTLVSLGLVALAEIIYENVPGAAVIGIRPIKIDLGMVAAIMTIIGYSLNDTIVILDRIRENRGKLAFATKDVINDSINQTMSRTIVTAGTALVSLLVLFFFGGEGVASFAYTMICGMIVGTYSTIAVAAPIVYTKHEPAAAVRTPDAEREDEESAMLPGSV